MHFFVLKLNHLRETKKLIFVGKIEKIGLSQMKLISFNYKRKEIRRICNTLNINTISEMGKRS
jgi:hypothetical protein